MATPPEDDHPGVVVPCLCYRDVPAMLDWLCHAFGFEKHLMVEGSAGKDGEKTIAHAQLCYGNGMIMAGSLNDGPWGRHIAQPGQIGGRATQTVYVVVPDADMHYARAREAGADILIDLKDEDYGGRGYTCRDPEGHIWSFGTYDPWKP